MRNWLIAQLEALLTWLKAGADLSDELAAVKQAFCTCGLPEDQFDPRFDLKRTGKLHEVLHHAEYALGLEHDLVTVADLVAYLESRG